MSADDNQYKARILLGIWGESFIKNFLESSLPGLLAPGNIPALAAEFPVTFVFLTVPSDIEIFETSPIFARLKQYCAIEFISIKDLILFGYNYSTALTYAYDRAIRLTGVEMLKTYFIFMTSDYLMADGSMLGLLRYIKKGYSGICAGNFQVVEEDFSPIIQESKKDNVIAIPPRELLKLALPYLHPVAVASLINNNFTHNYNANRFFIKDDQHTLAGRFYLLHMLCIKPEVTHYNVGASCDYSFIPEMCPSGKIGIITDSDDYLVVETQPRRHEFNCVLWGRYQRKLLVKALIEWTTARHRLNSNHTIYYHANDLTAVQKERMEQELAKFIEPVNRQLNLVPPKPFNNHPYWIGATKAFKAEQELLCNQEEHVFVNYLGLIERSKMRKIYDWAFGSQPCVYSWHYRWLEYKRLLAQIDTMLAFHAGKKTIIFYDTYIKDFMHYRNYFETKYKNASHHFLPAWIDHVKKNKGDALEKAEACILLMRLKSLQKLEIDLPVIAKSLAKGTRLIIVIPNENKHIPDPGYSLTGELIANMNQLTNLSYKVDQIELIRCNQTVIGGYVIYKIKYKFTYSRLKRLLVYGLVALPGIFMIWCANWISRFFIKDGFCADIVISLTPRDESAQHE